MRFGRPIIEEFQGDYRWLSNHAFVDIEFRGDVYKSVEHAYMSAKCSHPSWKLKCLYTKLPGVVKKESRKVQLVDNWEDIKYDVMKECIEKKFIQEPFRTLLINTGDAYIQEGNRWGDTYWGVDLRSGMGLNKLGLLIMEQRDKLIIM